MQLLIKHQHQQLTPVLKLTEVHPLMYHYFGMKHLINGHLQMTEQLTSTSLMLED